MTITFHSHFAPALTAFVALRQSLGMTYQGQAYLLRAFDRFVVARGDAEPLTQALAVQFATADPTLLGMTQVGRYRVVRHFAQYLATLDPTTPLLDPKAITAAERPPHPYIFTDDELARLVQAARQIAPRVPLRGITLHAMIGLAASTGLRISEVVRLDRADVDLQAGSLLIRQTKFYKDRLVPLHPSTRDVLADYAVLRDAHALPPKSPAFFLNRNRTRFAANTFQILFAKVARRIGLRGPRGRGPHVHDLRHAFLVRRLLQWYRDGDDVQAWLPVLATYVGHSHYTDTAYYLTAIPELMALAAARMDAWEPLALEGDVPPC
jgi:integrase